MFNTTVISKYINLYVNLKIDIIENLTIQC